MYISDPQKHGLAFDPFKAIIAPRPIGWISTLNEKGVPNLAPYSFFNALSSSPHMLMFSSEGLKHSAANARASGEFVFSLSTKTLQRQMNISSDTLPEGVNEYEAAGLAMGNCEKVNPPRVLASPASMECKLIRSEELLDIHGNPTDTYLTIGQVVAMHINNDYIKEKRFDTTAAQPLARCGYRDYASVETVFELMRPTDGKEYDGVDR